MSWATRSAQRWCEKARRHEQHRHHTRALDAYSRAIQADATYGPAYLGLARLRERLDDLREAERLYSRAIQLPDVAAEALARRAALRRALGEPAAALRDLEAAVETGPEVPKHLERLGEWYVLARNWSAALATHRRLEAALIRAGDPQAAEQVHVKVRALTVLAGATDPVSAGRDHPNWVRRSLAEISR
jgi:tetratricopeptide (TPR) repeat protein